MISLNPANTSGHHDDTASITNAIEKGLSSDPMSQNDKELDCMSSENQAHSHIIFADIAETHGPGSLSKTVLGDAKQAPAPTAFSMLNLCAVSAQILR